jgi:2-C-methyl-D-erythritol 2,4-cyclodiphosphate synthase
MTVAGLVFDDEVGPEGHSDGDVVAHAVCDALLSAAGLGDIGSNFGTADPQWANASGRAFLSETSDRVRRHGYDIANVAVSLIGNRPRLGARRIEAEQVLSAVVGAPVTLTGTTTDGLGLTGRGEGIAAIATVLLTARTP